MTKDDDDMTDEELMELYSIEDLEDRENFYSSMREKSESFQEKLDLYRNEY